MDLRPAAGGRPRVRPVVPVGHVGGPRRQRLPGVSERDLPGGQQLRSQAGRLRAPRRDHAAADRDLHARRLLGGRQQGRLADVAHAVARDGLERGECGVPAGARRAGAGRGGGLLVRAPLFDAQAKTYNIDTNRLVVTGESAGGHLALTTGMIPESAGLDRECAGAPLPKVAAIINWFGITDVGDVIDGPNRTECGGAVAGQPAESGRDRQARVAAHVYPRGPAAGFDDSRRCRSDGALPAGGAAARSAFQGRRSQSAGDHPRRKARRLHARRADQDLCRDPGISGAERAGPKIVNQR